MRIIGKNISTPRTTTLTDTKQYITISFRKLAASSHLISFVILICLWSLTLSERSNKKPNDVKRETGIENAVMVKPTSLTMFGYSAKLGLLCPLEQIEDILLIVELF